MPNIIDSNGIEIQTYDEIVDAIVNGQVDIPGFKQIYGDDIIVDSDTPDGQMINIFALAKQDILDLIVQDYNSKDPDQAVGVALDAVSELCGIFRKGGTYTEVAVNVTVDRNVTLNGLDTEGVTPYTIADNQGNQFYLKATTALTAGSTSCAFRAKNIGSVQVLPNTLTVPVTIILGVTAVNNPASPTQDGEDQESDAAFRIRRQKSVAIPAKGYLQNLLAGLLNTDGVTAAAVYENVDGSTDGDGIPGHSIWVIVQGGTDEDVAQVIYVYRNAGCGMKGDEEVEITQVDDTTFTIKFDRPSDEDLYMALDLSSIGGGPIDEEYIKQQIVALYDFSIYTPADITTLCGIVRSIDPTIVVNTSGVGAADEQGQITGVSINAAGTGYSVDDILTIVQSGATLGSVRVTSVGGSGEVTGISIETVGQQYSTGTDLATTGGGGSDCTIDIDTVANDFSSIKYPSTKKGIWVLTTDQIQITTS